MVMKSHQLQKLFYELKINVLKTIQENAIFEMLCPTCLNHHIESFYHIDLDM